MYSENSFKNYIFWIKVKRAFLMLIFSIVGALIGVALSELIVNILLFDQSFRVVITAASTLLFFGISLLITANTGKEVQDGYWKIAVLRKLTVISKKLDALENLDTSNPNVKKAISALSDIKDDVFSENLENNKKQSKSKNIKKEDSENN